MRLTQVRNTYDIRGMITLDDLMKVTGGEKFYTHLAGRAVNSQPRYNLSFLIENLSTTLGLDKATSLTIGSGHRAVKWNLVNPNSSMPKIMESFSTSNPGISTVTAGMQFKLVVDRHYFFPLDFILLPNGSLLHVTSSGRSVGRNVEYIVTVPPGPSFNTSQLVVGAEVMRAYNTQPEFSQPSFFTKSSSHETHIEYSNKSRLDWRASGEALASGYYMAEVPLSAAEKEEFRLKGNKLIFAMSTLQKDAMQEYMKMKEIYYMFARTTLDEYGNPKMFAADGQALYNGNGILNQIDQRNKSYLPIIDKDIIKEIIYDLSQKCESRNNNTFVALVGPRLMNTIRELFDADIKQMNIIDSPLFVSQKKGPNGARLELIEGQCSVYTFGTNTIIFTENEMFASPYLPSTTTIDGRRTQENTMLILDFNMYNGHSNIITFKPEGRELILATQDGIGGPDGKTSSKVAIMEEGSSGALVGHYGALLQNPYSSALYTVGSVASR